MPPFEKGTDSVTPAVALGSVDEAFFRDTDFAIDCDGCTACCRGDDGPIILPGEANVYASHKDDKGNWRLDQTAEGHCVYLDTERHLCAIHYEEAAGKGPDPADRLEGPSQPPRICRDFDCRSIIIKFNQRGLDFMVNSGQLPLEVVVTGRRQLQAFNNMIETRALSVGADLSSLMMVPAEENPDVPDDAA